MAVEMLERLWQASVKSGISAGLVIFRRASWPGARGLSYCGATIRRGFWQPTATRTMATNAAESNTLFFIKILLLISEDAPLAPFGRRRTNFISKAGSYNSVSAKRGAIL